MTSQKSAFWKNNMNYGAVAGFAIVIISIIFYFLNISDESFMSLFILIAILISVSFIGTKYLKKIENGKISYSRALGSGTLICLFASIIIALYAFIFYKFIDTEAIGRQLSLLEDSFYKKGMPDDQIEMTMDISRKFTTPITMAIGKVFSFTLWGFLFSLITSAFIRKKSNSYDAAMAEIEKEINEEKK